MRGRVESGQLVTLERLDSATVGVDDVLLVRWKGNYILHIVRDVRDDRILIGNNLGKINGWAFVEDVFAIATAVED